MPTQLQLEGAELEPLLARVRAEHGSSARIVSAEKVRTGGVGGFFAKAHFEITVEVDDPVPTAPAQRPTSILDLADEVSAVERTSAAAVSTESTSFAAVLARLGATAGEPDPAPAAVVPQQRRPVSPQQPRRTTPRPQADAPAPTPTPAPTPRRRRTDAPALKPSPGRAVAVRPTASSGVRTVPAPGTARPAPGTAVAVRPRGTVATRPPTAGTAPNRVARSAGALATAARQVPARHAEAAAQLAGLGLPDHLRPTAAVADLHAALVQSLRTLPKPPRLAARAGSVVAIVGPQSAARELAAQMADELGIPRSAVVSASASSSGLRTTAQARTRRQAWSRRRHATIVVVDTPLTAAGALRARALLDALEPASTWAVVEATRKPRDVGAWTRAVGRVDALALTAVDETADPAAVLELGIPVSRLGARKATPALWATLLTDRVAA